MKAIFNSAPRKSVSWLRTTLTQLLILLVITLSTPLSVQADGAWSPMTSGTSYVLAGAWGSSASNVFVVGFNGLILHYDGNEAGIWTHMSSGTAYHLRGIWGNSASDVFAVGDNLTILHYNGSTWGTMTSPTSTTLYGVWGSSANDVFAVGGGGTIMHYNGRTWSTMTSPTSTTLYGVWGSSATDIFAVGTIGTILHYDGIWKIETLRTGGCESSIDLDSGGYPHISHSTVPPGALEYVSDNGTAWNHETVAGGIRYTSLAIDSGNHPHISYYDWYNKDLKYASDNGTGWVIETVDSAGDVGGRPSLVLDTGGYPHISYDDWGNMHLKYAYKDGTGWHIETVESDPTRGPGDSSLALDSKGYPHISYNDAWAYSYHPGEPSQRYASENSTGWTLQTVNYSGNLALDASDYPHIAYPDNGLKYASYNGTGWVTDNVDAYNEVNGKISLALDSNDHYYPHIAYTGYVGSKLLKYASYNGTTWDIETVDSSGNADAAWGNSLALDSYGNPHISYEHTIDVSYHYLKYATYNDSGWSTMSSGTSNDLYGIGGNSSSDVFAVGQGGKILHYNGTTWSSMTSSTGYALKDAWGNSGKNVFAIGDSGTVLHFDGTTWRSMNSGITNHLYGLGGTSDNNTFAVGISGIILRHITYPAATIVLTAVPGSMIADGSSTSTLTANVKDRYGNPVIDGTDVVFSTSKGTVGGSDMVDNQTIDGIATATLMSEVSTQIVIADVSATADSILKTIAVFFSPPAAPPITDNKTETVSGSGTITDASTGGSVTIDATGSHTITTAKYGSNPGGTPSFEADGNYYDVHVDNIVNLNSIIIQFSPVTASTIIYFWNGSAWVEANNQTYAGGIVTVSVTSGTTPSLADLSGLVFGSGLPPITAPTVTNASGASSIMATTAILNGNLTDDGGAQTTVSIYGGSFDGGTPPGSWEHTDNLSIRSRGAFSLSVRGLTPGSPYYYICSASNSAGTANASTYSSFTTQAALGLWKNYWAGPGTDWHWFSSGGP